MQTEPISKITNEKKDKALVWKEWRQILGFSGTISIIKAYKSLVAFQWENLMYTSIKSKCLLIGFTQEFPQKALCL